MMNQLFGNSLLFGGNAPFVEELYENYLDNPGSVSEQWREYFDKLAQLPGHVARDVPHLPVINAFAEQARKGGYRAIRLQAMQYLSVTGQNLNEHWLFCTCRNPGLPAGRIGEDHWTAHYRPACYGTAPLAPECQGNLPA